MGIVDLLIDTFKKIVFFLNKIWDFQNLIIFLICFKYLYKNIKLVERYRFQIRKERFKCLRKDYQMDKKSVQ